MILPPPNITGKLHLGHALTLTVQDALVRWRSMYGDRVVWVPGTDHAGIATQAMVERHLWSKLGVRRQQLSRAEFLQHMQQWQRERQKNIRSQVDRMCVALDWNRQFFTLDPEYSEAVTEAFIRLFDSGQIYRSQRIVNWCCRLRSVVSDIEVEHQPVDTTLYDVAYSWQDAPDVQLVVSTTRPETILADCAVAVHPMDVRYERWQGRKLLHPLLKDHPPLPVLADTAVEPEFGTGVVKITPAHDAFDFELAARHGLTGYISMFSEDGSINEYGGSQFQGVERENARSVVVDALRACGALRGQRSHPATIPVCQRTGDIIEPMLKQQWYLRTGEMAKKALEAVHSGELVLDPPSYDRIWQEWLENSRDWCISRQLWWGHRLPLYRVVSKSSIDDDHRATSSLDDRGITADQQRQWVAARSADEALLKAGVDREEVASIERDEDVLDTWFSSALVPFAAFGWPKQSGDLESLFPLDLMETGHDILFFWVARMVMLSQTLTGKLPFKRVLLHGLICDGNGQKMSKSKGNVIDPDDVIDGATLESLLQRVDQAVADGVLSDRQADAASSSLRQLYTAGIDRSGCDALRWAFSASDFRGANVSFDMNDVRQARLFCNKVWQAARFVCTHAESCQLTPEMAQRLSCSDLSSSSSDLPCDVVLKWARHCLAECVATCHVEMSAHRLHLAVKAIDQFLYRQFCDVVLEAVKPPLRSESLAVRQRVCHQLIDLLRQSLLLLQPFMPRISAELLEQLQPFSDSCSVLAAGDGVGGAPCIQPGPSPQQLEKFRDDRLAHCMCLCLDMVRQIRSAKKERSAGAVSVMTVFVDCNPLLEAGLLPVVATLARCDVKPMTDTDAICRDTVDLHGEGWSLKLQIELDRDFELKRINDRRQIVNQKLDNLNTKIEAKNFARKPEHLRGPVLKKRLAALAELELLQQQERSLFGNVDNNNNNTSTISQ